MTREITDDDLNQILAHWDKYDKPKGVEDKAWKLMGDLYNKISEMLLLLAHPDKNNASAFGEQLGAIVTRPALLCYFIGYELASGRISSHDGTGYLMAATKSIDSFVLELLAVLTGKGIISQGKGLVMVMEISKLTGEAANNICCLGIENFGKIRYR